MSMSERGFSLIELMVALSIFAIVMMVGVGTLLVLIDANAKAQALSSAMTNLSFAIDSMTRNLRTGREFYCSDSNSLTQSGLLREGTNDCSTSNPAEGIVFTPGFESDKRMAYRLNGTSIEQRIDDIDDTEAGEWVPITSDEPPAAVSVGTLAFVAIGTDDTEASDEEQPQISILIEGEVENGLDTTTPFRIQSNVTQRVLNLLN